MQRLYDSDMQLIGYLSEGAAGRVSVLDSDYKVLGYYYPSADKTYTKDMALVGGGTSSPRSSNARKGRAERHKRAAGTGRLPYNN